eukprot:6658286-Prymnesium_polylepis.2
MVCLSVRRRSRRPIVCQLATRWFLFEWWWQSLPDVVADEHSGIGAVDTELQGPASDAFKFVEHLAAWILFEGELDAIDVDLPVLDALVPDGLLARHHVPPGAVEASAIASTRGAPTERHFSRSHHDLLKQPNPERCLAK